MDKQERILIAVGFFAIEFGLFSSLAWFSPIRPPPLR